MHLTLHPDAASFLAAAEPFLTEHEAINCLPLGLAAQHRDHPERITFPPYFATVDDAGRVVAAALRTIPQRFVLSLAGSPDAVGLIAADARGLTPPITTITGPAPVTGWFAERWQALGGAVETGMAERLYALTRVNHPAGAPGRARRATPADRDLLIRWFTEFELEAFGIVDSDIPTRVDTIFAIRSRGIYLWEDGAPVSMAGFGGRTPRGIRIGPVYTPLSQRGRGYASACVARLSQDMLDSGLQFCSLYTDLANPTSNHIYQVIGYQPICDVQEFHLHPHPP
jgi:predicted GNAT family acetyltransferase